MERNLDPLPVEKYKLYKSMGNFGKGAIRLSQNKVMLNNPVHMNRLDRNGQLKAVYLYCYIHKAEGFSLHHFK